MNAAGRAPLLWGDVARPWLRSRTASLVVGVLAPLGLALAVGLQPLAALAATVAVGLFLWLWRWPGALVPILIVCMGNVKINYYAGFFTFFPEYLPVVMAAVIWVLRWMEGRRRIEEPRLVLLFLAFVLAGALSFVNAPQVSRVFSKAVLAALALVIFYLTLTHLQERGAVRRAIGWVEGCAGVMAAYGVFQMIGSFAGIDTSLGLTIFEEYGNPDFHYGIGAPVVYQFAHFFRANALFNDSNILAGYLAAALALVVALFAHHSTSGQSARARVDGFVLMILSACMLLTLSRSGFLAVMCGAGAVVLLLPQVLRQARVWALLAVAATVAIVLSVALDINPLLLVIRLGQTFDRADTSTRTHYDVGIFALDLLRRYPLTGVGLNNFGAFYSAEMDWHFPNMMTHSAPLTYFSEAGLLGGCAFLALIGTILHRSWHAVRGTAIRAHDPELYAWNVGLLGALIALLVANLFYDYYLRTFIWVLSALAVAAARLAVRSRSTAP